MVICTTLVSSPLSLATRNKIIWLVYSLKGLNKGKVMTRSTAQSIGERGCYYIAIAVAAQQPFQFYQ